MIATYCQPCSTRYDATTIVCPQCGAGTFAVDKKPNSWGWIIFASLLVLMFFASIAQSSQGGSGSNDAAYDALRERGFSDKSARDAAPAVKRLCNAGGGRDC